VLVRLRVDPAALGRDGKQKPTYAPFSLQSRQLKITIKRRESPDFAGQNESS